MEREVRYCTTEDGVRIAYRVEGEGPALVCGAALVETFSLDHLMPQRIEFFKALGNGRQLLRYDWRGIGLSQRDVRDLSLEDLSLDIDAVTQAAGVERFAIWAPNVSSPRSLYYAATRPERVSRLITYAGYSHGTASWPRERLLAYAELCRTNWQAAAQFWADLSLPQRRQFPEAASQLAEILRSSISGESFAWLIEYAIDNWDATPLLRNISAPTLLLHRRDDNVVPFATSVELAASIPGARLMPLEGNVLSFVLEDPRSILNAINAFLDEDPEAKRFPARGPDQAASQAPSGTAVILFADIAGSTALTERLGDAAFRSKARDLDAALRAVIREHAGTPIEGKLLGDGVLAVFSSARQAIEAALACGKAGDEGGLPLHLGLHAGDVIREDNNIYGGAVNIAARISGLSAAGEVLVSETVRSLARTSAGVHFEDRGERELKGVGEAVRVWAIIAEAQ